jgi:serine/threonine-protein phosphatase 6 regulatory ankyrin repeat subunit B
LLRSKIILGNAHENSEELERARELKEKEAAL